MNRLTQKMLKTLYNLLTSMINSTRISMLLDIVITMLLINYTVTNEPRHHVIHSVHVMRPVYVINERYIQRSAGETFIHCHIIYVYALYKFMLIGCWLFIASCSMLNLMQCNRVRWLVREFH